MSLLSQVISRSSIALTLVQNYFLSPYLAGIRIETENYKEIMDDDISQQVIINSSDGKIYQTDNIVPKPTGWQIQGYLTPTILEISAISPLLMPSLILQKEKLRQARMSRKPVEFIPLNKESLNNPLTGAFMVGIEHLEFETRPDVANKIPISVTLKEIPVLSIITVSNAGNAIPSGVTNFASSQVTFGTSSVLAGALSVAGFL